MQWILGVDGGGTKTVAVAGDLIGAQRGRIEVGAANYHVIGLAGFKAIMEEILTAAEGRFGLRRDGLRLVSLGLAGVDRPPDRKAILAVLADLRLDCRFIVNNDAQIALRAGLGQATGIMLMAGTGSIAYGVNNRGHSFRAGGWGHIVSDEGSGYDIGRQALVRGIRSREGRDLPSLLLTRIMEHLQVADMAGLIDFVHGDAGTKAAVAALAEVVVTAARAGDTLAARILTDAADALVGLVDSVLAQGFVGGENVAVCVGGSVLVHCEEIRRRVADRLQGRATVVLPVAEPVLGALAIGYDCLNCGEERDGSCGPRS